MGLTRTEFLARLGMLKIVEPMVEDAYLMEEAKIWEGDLDDSPHGDSWSTSFHASSFPGDDPYACERLALYGLMNVPESSPIDRRGRMYMDAGKNLELELVRRFGKAGWLLSADQTSGDDYQTNFIDEVSWLSGSPDIIVIPFGWDRGHVVEVKGRGMQRPPRYRELRDPLSEMRAMREQPNPKHERQLGAYIGMANREFHKRVPEVTVCEETWSICTPMGIGKTWCPVHRDMPCLKRRIEMKPIVDGTLLYVALDDGSVTWERLYGLNERWFGAGRATLRRWRQDFLDGELPPRPDGWMWSKDPFPCKWCPMKKSVCKPDDKAGITRLEDSHAIEVATQIRPGYSYDDQRRRVLGRWEEQENA